MRAVPALDAEILFGAESAARRDVDATLARAARELGFLTLENLPPDVPLGADCRRSLLRIFELPEAEQRALWRASWAPENPNVYRGLFPLEAGIIKQGFDLGPDPLVRRHADAGGDVLAETSPLPEEASLPGWRDLARDSFRALERVGDALLHALARTFGLPETHFDEAFRDGNHTLRMMTYPAWPERARQHGWPIRPVTGYDGARRYDIGGEHTDSGFVTLLQQDAPGLQVRPSGDTWIDVPPSERGLVVNFGKLLERWTGGRLRATEHRVLAADVDRSSIGFFHEPRIDAVIESLPLEGSELFEPFVSGDHMWEAMSMFSEFKDLERHPSEIR